MANIVGYIRDCGDYSQLRYIEDKYLDESLPDAHIIIEDSIDLMLRQMSAHMLIDGLDINGKEGVAYVDYPPLYDGIQRRVFIYSDYTVKEKTNG